MHSKVGRRLCGCPHQDLHMFDATAALFPRLVEESVEPKEAAQLDTVQRTRRDATAAAAKSMTPAIVPETKVRAPALC